MNTHYTNPYTGQQLTVARPNPQKRNILIQKLGRAPWWLLILLGGVLLFAVSVADSMTYQNAWTAVQRGIWTTIWVTLVAYTISLVMGLVLALLRRPSTSMVYNIFVYQPVTAYVELVRGIPTLVLVFYFALALAPQVILLLNDLGRWLLDSGINPGGLSEEMMVLRARDFPTVWRAILALAVSYSAFL
ncbi:MAG: ABC transporter permease subunit, partial [Phototrophicaceae bacterium]